MDLLVFQLGTYVHSVSYERHVLLYQHGLFEYHHYLTQKFFSFE